MLFLQCSVKCFVEGKSLRRDDVDSMSYWGEKLQSLVQCGIYVHTCPLWVFPSAFTGSEVKAVEGGA